MLPPPLPPNTPIIDPSGNIALPSAVPFFDVWLGLKCEEGYIDEYGEDSDRVDEDEEEDDRGCCGAAEGIIDVMYTGPDIWLWGAAEPEGETVLWWGREVDDVGW